MPRRKKTSFTRDVGVDPRFSSPVIQKFINVVMWRGKKNVARNIVYGAIDTIAKRIKGDEKKAIGVFNKAFEQVTPIVEVRPRRVGGSVYQIPVEVPRKRAQALAMRWLIAGAKSRADKDMASR